MLWFIEQLIGRLFGLLQILIIANILLSWIPIPDNRVTVPIKRFIYDVTEPILGWFRSLLPAVMVGGMGLDLSPLVAILVLALLRSFVLSVLRFVAI